MKTEARGLSCKKKDLTPFFLLHRVFRVIEGVVADEKGQRRRLHEDVEGSALAPSPTESSAASVCEYDKFRVYRLARAVVPLSPAPGIGGDGPRQRRQR